MKIQLSDETQATLDTTMNKLQSDILEIRKDAQKYAQWYLISKGVMLGAGVIAVALILNQNHK